ncbi:Stress-induced-phospho 1, partial [Paramuricea clavata]
LIADLLFEKLGGLPLALEQSCAYIKYLRCTLSDYLESYNKQSLQLLKNKKASSPCSTSEDRLAVHTTWLLNFEHIRKNKNGMVAIRFLNATAFMNPNEIQKELINVGEPHVDDKAYCDHVSSSLGSLEVLRLLTDFSLFKETRDSSLTVHRLVQEVIRENLEPEEKVESIVDAARLLGFAFLNCPSPDELVESVVCSEDNDRFSLHSTDPSRFYKWRKICLHAYEINKNLEKFLNIFCDAEQKTVFLPEVARIVYECALHLNVNNYTSEAKTVAEFAYRILDWGDAKISEEGLKALFPHIFPLTESFRRLIQYSCKAPLDTSNPGTSKTSVNDSRKSEIEKMRLKGNNLFKESNFQEAIEIYSSCIDISQGTDSFDPRLLSNRASAYLRLKQFNNALKDAEEYITYFSECWRGYAKKALALQGLNEKWNAVCASALAFYHNRNVFEHFPPFQTSFPNVKQSIHVCDNMSSLISSLAQLAHGIVSDIPSKIIVLEPGKYYLSTECFDGLRTDEDQFLEEKCLWTGGVCLVGVGHSSSEPAVTLSFGSNFGLLVSRNFYAVNLSFIFNFGNWLCARESMVMLFNCSFTSNINELAFVSQGSLSVKKCQFINCKSTALCAAGSAEVEDSVFSGNMSVGLKVVEPGNLVLKNSKLHGNQWGLEVKSATCDVTGCQIYDNKKIGVAVENGKIQLTRNEIFHNDRHGIFLCKNSSAVIKENDIFENGWQGIEKTSDAWCRISRNKIYQNKCGGIHVVPITKAPGHQQSIVEFNEIFGNQGPGIDEANSNNDEIGSVIPSLDALFASEENFIKAKCNDNKLKNNVEIESGPPLQDVSEICFFCHKQGQLKKCTRCFTAKYCNRECQRSDWKRHKNNCARLLKKYSVLVKVLPLSSCLIGDKKVLKGVEIKAPFSWLEPSGPQYAEAPKPGKLFIVKIQAADSWRRSNEGGTRLAIEDRSLTINGDLDVHEHSGRIYHIVRECGSNCNSYGWKKIFFGALLAKNKMVRVFVSNFPGYQRW